MFSAAVGPWMRSRGRPQGRPNRRQTETLLRRRAFSINRSPPSTEGPRRRGHPTEGRGAHDGSECPELGNIEAEVEEAVGGEHQKRSASDEDRTEEVDGEHEPEGRTTAVRLPQYAGALRTYGQVLDDAMTQLAKP